MHKHVVAIAFCCAFAVFFPRFFMSQNSDSDGAAIEEQVKTTKTKTASKRKKRSRKAVGYRKRGHFSFNARLNGRNVTVLVDTGATSVAINRSTARRIGIDLRDRDFRYRASTANGVAMYARAKIDEIRIDGIRVYDVNAAVLDDASLSGTLLGMSFLNKLKSFEIKRNKLTMLQ